MNDARARRRARRRGDVLDRGHRPPRGRRLRGGRPHGRRGVRPPDRPRREAARRRDGANARLQRLDTRPDPPGARGLGARRQRGEPHRPGGDGSLARAAPRQPIRRHAPDAGADPGRRHLLLPHRVPRPRRLLVPPAHPRGLRAGDGPLRQHPRRPGRSRLLGAGAPRGAAHPRRRAARGWPDRALPPLREHPHRHGPVRQPDAGRWRRRTSSSTRGAARWCAST